MDLSSKHCSPFIIYPNLHNRDQVLLKSVLVINLEVKDNHEEAAVGAHLAFDLCEQIEAVDSWEDSIDDILISFENKHRRKLMYSISFSTEADLFAGVYMGHNVVLISNHQTEADPIIISLLLEKTNPQLTESMIYVAGDRVIIDPLCKPFSMDEDINVKQRHNTLSLPFAFYSLQRRCLHVTMDL
ncbi:hypothetical protein V6N13_135341 [Hibiscus sabdariffa]|uniref:RNA polymerase II subunit A C-terminal domain phosphatase SSU72 n=1 Tax=Hibiscus sabdariffa TaxID=183260 RepID=A0ABR2R6J1_9ROSI